MDHDTLKRIPTLPNINNGDRVVLQHQEAVPLIGSTALKGNQIPVPDEAPVPDKTHMTPEEVARNMGGVLGEKPN